MAAIAALLPVVPLLRARKGGPARGAHALEVYRLQLAELDADVARGTLMDAEAAASRIEIQRRMLRAADETVAGTAPDAGRSPAHLIAVALALIVPFAAIALYLLGGSPALTPNVSSQKVAGADREHLDMAALTAQLAERLAKSPDDIQGWMLLGRSYMNLDEPAKSVAAYRRAVALTGAKPAPMVLAEFAEALVNAEDGVVGDAAAGIFHQVLEIMPGEPRARFYLGLQRAQTGDVAGGLEDWVALIKSAEPGAPWAGMVRAQAAEAARQLNLELADLLPDAQAPPGGPSPEDVQAAAQMPEGERTAMIENMVAGLAERLNTQEPDNVDGWLKLARAYGVLGRTQEQLAAFGRAAGAGPERADALEAYADALLASGESKQAMALLQRLLAMLPAGSAEYENLSQKMTQIQRR